MFNLLKINTAWPQSAYQYNVSTFNFEQIFVSRVWKTSHDVLKTQWYICFVIKVARSRAFSNLSSHRIEINYEHMAILWTRFNHMFWTCFGSKFALGIRSVLLSFPLVIWSALSSLFPRDLIFFAVSNRKPI